MITAHVVLWAFFIVMSLLVYSIRDARGVTYPFIWIGFVISIYGIGLSITAGVFKLLATLAGF